MIKDNKDENTKVEDTEAEEALHRMRTQLGLYYPQVLSTINDHHHNHDNAELKYPGFEQQARCED